MKIATWNVNGIRAREAQFLDWIAEEKPDVICLQEIKAEADKVPESICDLEGYACHWHGSKGYSGVALHIRRDALNEPPRFEHPPFDFETRIVTGSVGNLVIASTYVPNGGKDFEGKMRFLDELDQFAERMQNENRELIICGDLNVALEDRDVHPKERKPNAVGQLPEERAALRRIIGRGLVDLGRAFDPDSEELFTWWAPWRNLRQRNIGWRIDYVLASKSLAERATDSGTRREFGTSDHAPVTATFDLDEV